MTITDEENAGDNGPGCRLEAAEADLAAAEEELAQATSDVAKAEAEVRAAEEASRREYIIEVSYNGVPKTFEVRRDELVKKLLDEAIKAFGPLPQPHTLALYNDGGTELKDGDTMEQAGVKPHDKLLLRPSKVKGGA